MATTVVYASGQSGWVRALDSVYLDAARDNAPTTFVSATATSSGIGQWWNGSSYLIYQTCIEWDTSAVGTDTVSNVDFEVDGSNAPATDHTLESYSFDWGGTLEFADYRDSDTDIPALGSTIASYDTSGGWDTGTGYNNDLNWTDTSAINGSGDTRIVVISDQHRTETAPTTDDVVAFELTGNTNDARLTITHAPSVTLTYAKPDSDVAATGWATAPLWSKVNDDPDSPDATVITGAS